MKVGDLVRRKRSDVHGWRRDAVGIIIYGRAGDDGRILRVLEPSGKIFEWEDWELEIMIEVMNEAR